MGSTRNWEKCVWIWPLLIKWFDEKLSSLDLKHCTYHSKIFVKSTFLRNSCTVNWFHEICFKLFKIFRFSTVHIVQCALSNKLDFGKFSSNQSPTWVKILVFHTLPKDALFFLCSISKAGLTSLELKPLGSCLFSYSKRLTSALFWHLKFVSRKNHCLQK